MVQSHALGILAITATVACASPPPGPAPFGATASSLDNSQLDWGTMNELVELKAGDQWRIVNDGVMGGRSESAFSVDNGHGVFSGNLSPENGGGFASVRTVLESQAMPDMVAVAIRVLGDGKRYQFRIRTNERWDGPAYKYEFATTVGEWVEVIMPLSDFELSLRGRLVPDAPPLDARRVRQVGFLISNKQWGPFRLEVESIRAARAGEKAAQ